MRAVLRIIARRKNLSAAAWVFALLLLPAARAAAQEPGAQVPGQEPGTGRPDRDRGGSLMRRLNLTPEQLLQLREIRRQGEPAARELARRVRLARRALDEAIYADAAEEAAVEQRSRELAEAQAALVRLRASTELKVRRVLTPEQLRLFRDLRRQAQRRQMLERRRRGAGARPGPAGPGEDPPDADAPQGPHGPGPAGPPPPRRRRP